MTTIILTLFHNSVPDQVFIPEYLDAFALPGFFIFFIITRGLASLRVRETAPGACFLFPSDQVILRIREKSRETDPERIRCGSIYSHRKPFTDARKYVPHRLITEIKSLGTLPREMTQISHSDASGHNVNTSGAARYFDYESAVALRNLAAAYGTDMPRYLLAPEVAVLLSKVTDLRKRLFIDTLWNTGGRLNEILPLTKGDFVLDDPLSAAPLVSPFVVLRTLKQRRLEESAGSRSRRRGRPTKEEQQAEQEAQAEIRDNPPRAVPLTDPAFVRRLREWFAIAQPAPGARLWDIRSEDTARSWISQAVEAAKRDGVTFSIRPVTPKTFRDSFAMHLVQHQVPQKVIQTLMGHKDAKSTEWYTRVFALDVTRQLGVRFSMDAARARDLLGQ
ncbi:tyrosine-type recombinase/integrase [Pantoea ananatis]|uniref:tyrosine-type recombinase/integrase n=2 Tax=Pantoea ananas TaxID=553 RepID=UPI0031F4897B